MHRQIFATVDGCGSEWMAEANKFDLVVVDECIKVNDAIVWQVVQCIKPEGTMLCFVDENQIGPFAEEHRTQIKVYVLWLHLHHNERVCRNLAELAIQTTQTQLPEILGDVSCA